MKSEERAAEVLEEKVDLDGEGGGWGDEDDITASENTPKNPSENTPRNPSEALQEEGKQSALENQQEVAKVEPEKSADKSVEQNNLPMT